MRMHVMSRKKEGKGNNAWWHRKAFGNRVIFVNAYLTRAFTFYDVNSGRCRCIYSCNRHTWQISRLLQRSTGQPGLCLDVAKRSIFEADAGTRGVPLCLGSSRLDGLLLFAMHACCMHTADWKFGILSPAKGEQRRPAGLVTSPSLGRSVGMVAHRPFRAEPGS